MNKDFIFGVATSSYQIEGTHNEFVTIWDTLCEKKNAIKDNSNGSIACDHYHKYIEDVDIIEELGVDSYRFSISWARVQRGKNDWNQEGLDFYRSLLEELNKKGIKPSITLYHWDMPQWVMDETGGFTSEKIIPYFLEYAKKIFSEYDGMYDTISTINEPYCVAAVSYLFGEHAPAMKDEESYVKAQYYVMLAHGVAADYYKRHYTGKIGIVLNHTYGYAKDDSDKSKKAIIACNEFHNDIYLSPLFKGTYPVNYLNRLEKFNIDYSFITEEGLKLINTPIDFLGINYYSRLLLKSNEESFLGFEAIEKELPVTDMGWEIAPNTLKDIVYEIRDVYTDIPILITENGAAFKNEKTSEGVKDENRVDFFKKHLEVVEELSEKANVVGYYVWSLMDNFEWAYGYEKRFGIVHVDYDTLERTKKDSYYFIQGYIRNKRK